MGTYNFTTTEVAVPFIAKFEESLPVLMNSNKQLDKEYKSGTGTTITMLIPDHPDVIEGSSISGSLAYTSGNKTLTLVQRNVAIDANSVERALDIHSFDEQVAKPYGAKLASKIQTLAVEDVQLSANTQYVFDTTNKEYFNEVADAVAGIRDARSFGNLIGALSPQFSSKVAQSGFKFFNPNTQISDIFTKSRLGEFQTAMFYHTPDVKPLVTGDLSLGTATVDTTISAEGTNTLVIADAGLTGGEVVKKGTAFNIAGVDAVDIYGESIGQPYAFVAQADATAVAGSVTLSIAPVYFDKPLQNVSVASIASGAVVTQVHEADSRYLGGIIYDDMSLLFGSAKLAPIAGTESEVVTAGKALAVSCMKGPDVVNRREIVRWDTLTGTELVRPNWASAMWIKVG